MKMKILQSSRILHKTAKMQLNTAAWLPIKGDKNVYTKPVAS